MSATEAAVGFLATGAGVAAVAIDQLAADAEQDPPMAAGLAGAVTVGCAVLLFLGAFPRARAHHRAAQAALLTSAVGFLSVASAWTGLPFVLGAGGAMLGTAARRDAVNPRERGLAGFAVALGLAAVTVGMLAIAVL